MVLYVVHEAALGSMPDFLAGAAEESMTTQREPLTPERIAEIRARAEASSKDLKIQVDKHEQINLHNLDTGWVALLPHQCVTAIEEQQKQNAAFFCAAREDTLDLLADNDRLRTDRGNLLVATGDEEVRVAAIRRTANEERNSQERELSGLRTELTRVTDERDHLKRREQSIIEACERVGDGGQYRADIVSAIQRLRRERDEARAEAKSAAEDMRERAKAVAVLREYRTKLDALPDCCSWENHDVVTDIDKLIAEIGGSSS